jgi:hypothetical protein
MTEAEWMAGEDSERLLECVIDQPPRRFRLLSVACCRAVAPPSTDARSSHALDVAEREADNPAGETRALDQAWLAARTVEGTFFAECAAASATPFFCLRPHISLGGNEFELEQTSPFSVACSVIYAARSALAYDGARATPGEMRFSVGQFNHLIRDIFGNPFRPATFDPAWRTPTAVALAGQMYGSRDFGAMPILADALQDAGCDSAEVLDHCRGPGPHVRGCWVVDLVLGKA